MQSCVHICTLLDCYIMMCTVMLYVAVFVAVRRGAFSKTPVEVIRVVSWVSWVSWGELGVSWVLFSDLLSPGSPPGCPGLPSYGCVSRAVCFTTPTAHNATCNFRLAAGFLPRSAQAHALQAKPRQFPCFSWPFSLQRHPVCAEWFRT